MNMLGNIEILTPSCNFTTVQDGRAILPPLSAQPQTVTVGPHDDVVQLAAASIAFVQVDAAGAGASLAQLCQ